MEEFRLRMPAGMKDIDQSVSRDNFDIYSFLLIGVGSIYFILNDLGLSSTSNMLLALSLAESTVFLIIGFSSCSVQAENDVEVYRWRTWPLYIKAYIVGLIATSLMVICLAIFMASGQLDRATTFPLLMVSAILTFYLWKSANTKTLWMKPRC
jgi:hypothetical protein